MSIYGNNCLITSIILPINPKAIAILSDAYAEARLRDGGDSDEPGDDDGEPALELPKYRVSLLTGTVDGGRAMRAPGKAKI